MGEGERAEGLPKKGSRVSKEDQKTTQRRREEGEGREREEGRGKGKGTGWVKGLDRKSVV